MKNKCAKHNVELVATKTRYGTRFGCPVDGCTVRCWCGSTSTPCDAETAKLRNQCHAQFDPAWKQKRRFKSREAAYGWLRENMGMSWDECHFGKFDAADCRQALEFMKNLPVGAGV